MICKHDQRRLQELLHRLWGKATDHREDYVKAEWIEFQALLDDLNYHLQLIMR